MKKITVLLLLIILTINGKSQNYIIDSVVTGMVMPVTFELLPNSTNAIITLRSTAARVYNMSNNTIVSTFWNFSDSLVSTGERGLLGVCLDPNFNSNRYIYFYYTHNPNTYRVVRLTENSNIGTNPFIVFSETVASMASLHVGGNIHFGRDGKLYIIIGDNGNSSNAQSLTTFRGKLLRINSNGTIPADNPFYDDGNPATGNDDRIWALGLRNSFDFCVSPVNDSIYATENGANAFDEVNFVRKGKNYGWPICEGYCSPFNPLYRQPMHVWGAPIPGLTGIMVYNSTQMPWLNGRLLVTGFSDGIIFQCSLNNTLDSVVSRTQMLDLNNLISLKQGTDGYIYAIKGGGPTVSGTMYRIKPDLTGINNNGNPAGYHLSQNYPNPFNPATSIKYEIPKQSFVLLKIYNVLGIEIAAIVNESKQQGSYEVSWDASTFPSGVYFYELSAGEFKERKKMVLIK